jgi:PAS domain S-box-containing protein
MTNSVGPRRATTQTVLIVEDDRVMAELERRALLRAGFSPRIATSAADAGTLLVAGEIATVLLDYNLPDGDAWNLVTLAGSLEPRVPVIMVTAMGSEAIAAEAVRRGVAEYIVKSDGFIDDLGVILARVSALAAADEEMRRNNSLFHTIADNAHDAIVLLDGDGTILFASAAAEQMLGETPAALIGQDLADFLGVEDDTDWPRVGRAPGRRGAVRRVYDIQHAGGVTVSAEPAFASIGEGKAARTLAVLRDVTERVRLEDRLRHQERMEAIGQLTGGLAHDFNNLLGVVIGNLDLLAEQSDVSASVRELAQDALDAALRGAELTRGLLAFARRQELRPTRVDVNVSVGSVVRLLSRVLGADIRVEMSLTDAVWPVLVDQVQLETALTNLIANARDAMPHGGRLRVATGNVRLDADGFEARGRASFGLDEPQQAISMNETIAGDFAFIEVTDTGVGISAEVLDRVFEPFFTTKEVGQGTGLGLAMVFGFIRQSDGHIHAASEVGRGTTFRLYLPRVEALSAESPTRATAESVAPTGAGRTILVVEDNDRLRQLAVRQLRAAQYQVFVADGAAAAIEMINGPEAIDLLFTDIVMPGEINGVDLARLATTRRPALKVLLTSGFPDLHGHGHGHGDGDAAARSSHALLPKPYRSDALLRAVGAALD